MSKIESLQEKVNNAAEKVEKIKKTIERHKSQLEKKIKANSDEWDIKWKQEDIKNATNKLEEAELVLENWKNKLNKEIEKENFINNNIPPVIREFLEQWKTMVYDWHIKRYDDYLKYREKLQNEVEAAKIEYAESEPGDFKHYINENGKINREKFKYYSSYNKKMDEYLKEKRLDHRSIKAKEAQFDGGAVLTMATYRNESERLEWLNKTLEEDKRAKMIDLINRINEVVGIIKDANGLRISEKGNLDGLIIGDKGKALIETIGAGGYNIQCFHYRTLVHKLD